MKKDRIPFSKRVDNKERTNFEIKDIKNFQKLVDFYTKRKQIALQEMLEGNFAREKDKQYFPIFVDELKIGTTALKLHQKFGIPHSTVKMVLRNLASGNILKRKKVGRAYVYFLP